MTKQDAITIIMAVSALVALGLLVPALRRARAAGDFDASTALTLAMGWLVSFPIVVVVVSGGLERRLDIHRELVPFLPGWYENAVHLSMALLLAFAAMLLVRRLVVSATRRVVLHTAGLLAILLWAVTWLASGLQGGRLLSLSGLALLVCLMAATVLPRGRGACLGVGIFGVTLAAASGLIAAASWGVATVPCRHECVLGAAVTGALPNENLMGTTLVATLPFTYLGFRGRAGTWLAVYVAAMAIVSGSRGAMLTAVIVLAALLVLRPRVDATHPAPIRVAAASVLLTGAVLASVYIVLHDWSTAAYPLTDRPALWNVASDYTQQSPVFGHGPDKWEALYSEAGEIPRAAQHSTHNQWVDVLFKAGWVGAALLVGMVVAMIWTAGYARPAVLIALATVFMIGVGERAWSIGAADFVSFSLIALVLLGPTKVAAQADARSTGVPARPARPLAVAPG